LIKEKYISFFAFIYIIIFSILFNIFNFPEIVKSLISQPALLFVPYLFGRPLLFVIRKLIKIEKNKDLITEMFIEWSFGVISIIIFEIFLYTNYLFNFNYYIIFILSISFFSIFLKDNENVRLNNNYKDIIFVSFLSVLFCIIVSYFWSYPYSNENDYIQHLFLTSKIIQQNRPIIFHGAYLPTMHTLYAMAIRIFNINLTSEPLMLFWSTRFIQYPVYAIGLYILTFQIIKNRFFSIFATFIGTFLIYDIENFFLPWSIAPKNIISAIFVFGLYYCVKKYEENKIININRIIIYLGIIYFLSFFILYISNIMGLQNYYIGFYLLLIIILSFAIIYLDKSTKNLFLEIFIILESLIFFHSINGFMGGLFLLAILFILFNWQRVQTQKIKLFVLLASSFLYAILFFVYYGIIDYPNKTIIEIPIYDSSYLFGFHTVMELLLKIYPGILIFLFLISYMFIYAEKKYIVLLFYGFTPFLILLYFLPIVTSYRFLMYAHPFIIFLMSYGFYRIYLLLKNKSFQYLFIFFILLLSSANIYSNDIRSLTNPTIINLQKEYSIFEIGDFLKDSPKENSIVICSEWYQIYSSNYGLMDSIFLWENGKYRQDKIREIYLTNSSKITYDSIIDLLDNKQQIVPNIDNKGKEINRFYKRPTNVYILYDDKLAKYLGNPDSVNKFYDSEYFILEYEYKNENMDNFYVFRLKLNNEDNDR